MGAPLYAITGSNISFISLCSRIDNTFGYTHKMPEEIRNTMQKRPFEVNVSEVPKKTSRSFTNIVTLVTHLPGCAHLSSAKNGDYNCPRVLSGFGRRSFSVSGHDAWNSLPRQLSGIAVASTFKRHLKSELFFQAYDVSTTVDIYIFTLSSTAVLVL